MTKEQVYRLNNSWPQDSPELLLELFTQLTGCSSDEVEEVERAIECATSLAELPEGVLNNGDTVVHRLEAVLGARIVGPPPVSFDLGDIDQQGCLLEKSDKQLPHLVTPVLPQIPMDVKTSSSSALAGHAGKGNSNKTSLQSSARASTSASTSDSAGCLLKTQGRKNSSSPSSGSQTSSAMKAQPVKLQSQRDLERKAAKNQKVSARRKLTKQRKYNEDRNNAEKPTTSASTAASPEKETATTKSSGSHGSTSTTSPTPKPQRPPKSGSNKAVRPSDVSAPFSASI